MGKGMLAKRITVGIFLILGSFLLVMWGALPMAFEVLFIGIMGLNEFYNLANRKGIRPSKATGIFSGIMLFVSAYCFNAETSIATLTLLLIFSMFVFIFRKDHHVSSILDAGVTIMGYLYIGWLFGFIIHLRKFAAITPFGSFHLQQGAVCVIFLVLATSFTDIGCFFVGKFFGKRKLCPGISPGKTIEGSIGGLVTALITSCAWGYFSVIPFRHCIILALVLSVFAQLGDLWESILKRDAAVKDSGDAIAGHGGFLDRFDSLFITAPIAYLYFKYIVFWNW
jgi:phosphatidate cytidylyltransferase